MSYIGVSCFMHQAEVREVLAMLPLDPQRKLMVGTVASSKTLMGRPNSLPGKFPRITGLRSIYKGITDPRALNLVHYATNEPDMLAEQLSVLKELSGSEVHGFQLNIVWPDPKALYHLPKGFKVVLQISPQLMENGSPQAIATRLADYHGLVDSVLVDRSRGVGKAIDVEDTRRVFEAIRSEPRCVNIGLGLAGGLSAANLQDVAMLVREFDASIDAENALRDHNRDALDMGLVKEYVSLAFELFE